MNYTENFDLDFNGGGGLGLKSSSDASSDGCTLCGICLPVCPTYKLNEDIKKSPMGRIQIMRNMKANDYEFSNDDISALDSCLICRSCESVCPSKVAYSDMLESAKQSVKKQYKKPLLVKMLLRLVEKPGLLRMLSILAKPLQVIATNLPKRAYLNPPNNVLQGFNYLHYAPLKPQALKNPLPNHAERKVSLFTGCMATVFDRPVLQSTINVLRRCNVEVLITKKQTCCGALHAHNGESGLAVDLAKKNLLALEDDTIDAVISTASGCGQFLQVYDDYLSDESSGIVSKAADFSRKVSDISAYLLSSGVLDNIVFSSMDKTVAVHKPCSLKNDDMDSDSVWKVLNKIPGIKLVCMPATISCCGAGGSHLLSHNAEAKQIRNDSLLALKEMNPDILITSNVGCALHLKEGIDAEDLDIEVLHPVQLLEKQLS